LAEQGQEEEGIVQIRQGLSIWQSFGGEAGFSIWLAAGAYGQAGRPEEGLAALAEALKVVDKSGERFYETELYRLKGELTLKKSGVRRPESEVPNIQEAEVCFHKAIEIAREQQAKSLELRAVMSLVRLRQQQATQSKSRYTDHASCTRLTEAHTMLSEIYSWFTEGFETKDLQEAKELLAELA
jgi:tetratricopeptide (TPR) repeat protein